MFPLPLTEAAPIATLAFMHVSEPSTGAPTCLRLHSQSAPSPKLSPLRPLCSPDEVQCPCKWFYVVGPRYRLN